MIAPDLTSSPNHSSPGAPTAKQGAGAAAVTSQGGTAHHDIPTNPDVPLLLTVEKASVRMNIGRTLMYSLVRSGAIRSVKVGGRLRRVPSEALTDYIASQLVGDAQPVAVAA